MASQCMLRLTVSCAQVSQAELKPCFSIPRNVLPQLRLKRQLPTSRDQNGTWKTNFESDLSGKAASSSPRRAPFRLDICPIEF